MIHQSAETFESTSFPHMGCNFVKHPRHCTQIEHTIPQMGSLHLASHHKGRRHRRAYEMCHNITRSVGRWACIILIGSTYTGIRWHCMYHIQNMLLLCSCHVALASVWSPVWQYICQSSHNQWYRMVGFIISKYNIFHRPDETMLFVVVKAFLHIKIILFFSELL